MREADYDAYDLDDPKHPDWEDLAAERADLERKREKEDALPEADGGRILLAPERTQGFPLSRAERKPVSKRGKRAWVFLGLACFLAGMFILVEQARALPRPWLNGALCIYRHERDVDQGWRTNTGNGYYGGLQMDLSFQRTYGTWLLENVGTADKWTPTQQLRVAYRAHSLKWKGHTPRGWYPWPNTARECGLL